VLGRKGALTACAVPATVEDMERFPKIPHQSAGGGIQCCGYIAAEADILSGTTALRCDECGLVVGTIKTGILIDLVTLALATEMDKFIPDADHINALPGPLRRYIHVLETRADPAGDVAEIALLKENNAALWARVRELEAGCPRRPAEANWERVRRAAHPPNCPVDHNCRPRLRVPVAAPQHNQTPWCCAK
jgi:hypothetical protein